MKQRVAYGTFYIQAIEFGRLAKRELRRNRPDPVLTATLASNAAHYAKLASWPTYRKECHASN